MLRVQTTKQSFAFRYKAAQLARQAQAEPEPDKSALLLSGCTSLDRDSRERRNFGSRQR